MDQVIVDGKEHRWAKQSCCQSKKKLKAAVWKESTKMEIPLLSQEEINLGGVTEVNWAAQSGTLPVVFVI